MRPVTRTEPPRWTPKKSLVFGRTGPPGAFKRLFGTTKPTVEQCLRLLEKEAAGHPLTEEERAVLPAIQRKLGDAYREATPALLDDLGHYCAYCELPLHDPVPVEHVLPKSEYPTYTLDWYNLLPSCRICNSRKGADPSRAVVDPMIGGPSKPTPSDYRRIIRDVIYRWPDSDAVEGFFEVDLYWHDGSGWNVVEPKASVDAGTRQVSGPSVSDGTLRADIRSLGAVSVRVAAVVGSSGKGDKRTKALIDLVGLDRFPEPSNASDRRALFRTQVWFMATETFRGLEGVATLPQHVRFLVESSGFYWVWDTVARRISRDFWRVFREDTRTLLPGTDAARLP